jgi:hypothetical protein
VRVENFAPRAHKRTSGLLVLRFDRVVDRADATALVGELVAAGCRVTLPENLGDGLEVLAVAWRPPRPEDAAHQLAALTAAGERFGVATAYCVHGTARPKKGPAEVPAWQPKRGELPFPVDSYPEIIDELDWYDYGLAVKLGGRRLAGEEQLLDAFCELWSSSFSEFRHLGMEYDGVRRAAVLWIDRWSFLRSGKRLVRHTLWLAERINDVVPVVHASFQGAEMSWKYRGLTGDDSEPFVLGGNPLLAVHGEYGEAGVTAWLDDPPAVWGPAEIAAMLVALVERHPPDDPTTVASLVRLADRAIALDPDQEQARADVLTLLVHNGHIADALDRVREWQRPGLTTYLVELTGKHAPDHLPAVLDGLPVRAANVAALARYGLGPGSLPLDLWAHLATTVPADTPAANTPPAEAVGDALVAGLLAELATDLATSVVVAVGRAAPGMLDDLIRLIPAQDATATLYPAAYQLLRTPNSSDPRDATPESLLICERICELPAPADGSAFYYTWAHASAIIFAYHLGMLDRARDLVERSLHRGDENPAIYHNAACVYAGGFADATTALAMARRAVHAGYTDPEAIRTDDDLAILHEDPEFQALFPSPRPSRPDPDDDIPF